MVEKKELSRHQKALLKMVRLLEEQRQEVPMEPGVPPSPEAIQRLRDYDEKILAAQEEVDAAWEEVEKEEVAIP